MANWKMTCPEHGKMPFSNTQYGRRYSCRVDGCTVVCWAGSTSTPADQETRDLRHECHSLFDPLWQHGTMPRREAYRWLSKTMILPRKKAHIGMFTKHQCQILLHLMNADRYALPEGTQ